MVLGTRKICRIAKGFNLICIVPSRTKRGLLISRDELSGPETLLFFPLYFFPDTQLDMMDAPSFLCFLSLLSVQSKKNTNLPKVLPPSAHLWSFPSASTSLTLLGFHRLTHLCLNKYTQMSFIDCFAVTLL